MFLFDNDDNSFSVVHSSKASLVKSLPSAVYSVVLRHSGVYFHVSKVSGDQIVNVDTPQMYQLRREVRDFFDGSITSILAQNNVRHRRGVILHGEPGCGKTSMIRSLVPYLLEYNAVVLVDPPIGHIEGTFIPLIRHSDPFREIVILLDDFEKQGSLFGLVRLMDGLDSPDHIMVMCTTNYIQRIPDQIKSRPSRFGLIMEVPRLGKMDRMSFAQSKYPTISQSDLDVLVEMTLGDRLDHLNEVCKLHLMGFSREEIHARIMLAWHPQEGKDDKDSDSDVDAEESEEDDIFSTNGAILS